MLTGVLNIYKEKGYTSHDVVAIVRRIAETKKVGHTGTLDPDATGVLPICIGGATKLADYIASADKTYIAEVILGVETNTGDISGEVLAEKPVHYDQTAIQNAVSSFAYANRGEYLQVPPMFSAIKIGGKKLYEIARKGETIDRPPRPVVIHHIRIKDFAPEKNAFTIEVKCSKGTYIRSLAQDIGTVLGCGATMGALERTQSGMFHISHAIPLDKLKEAKEAAQLPFLLMPPERLLPYPQVFLKGTDAIHGRNGNPLPYSVTGEGAKDGDRFWLYDGLHQRIGLFECKKGTLRPQVML